MKRVENWDQKLIYYARESVGKDFEWGVTDCASLVRASIAAMYGEDVFSHVAAWSTLREAKNQYEMHGRASSILAEAGASIVASNYEQTGDIIVSPGEDQDGLPRFGVILTGGQVLLSTPESGVHVLSHWRSILVDGTSIYRMPV